MNTVSRVIAFCFVCSQLVSVNGQSSSQIKQLELQPYHPESSAKGFTIPHIGMRIDLPSKPNEVPLDKLPNCLSSNIDKNSYFSIGCGQGDLQVFVLGWVNKTKTCSDILMQGFALLPIESNETFDVKVTQQTAQKEKLINLEGTATSGTRVQEKRVLIIQKEDHLNVKRVWMIWARYPKANTSHRDAVERILKSYQLDDN